MSGGSETFPWSPACRSSEQAAKPSPYLPQTHGSTWGLSCPQRLSAWGIRRTVDQPGLPVAPRPAESQTTLAVFWYFHPLSIFSFFEAFLPQCLVPRTARLSSSESPGTVLLQGMSTRNSSVSLADVGKTAALRPEAPEGSLSPGREGPLSPSQPQPVLCWMRVARARQWTRCFLCAKGCLGASLIPTL